MIYIDENTTKLDIPKLDFCSPSKIKIKDILRNTIQEINISEIENTKYLYTINIEDWSFHFANGSQYEYYLYDESNKLITAGIIQCGEYNQNVDIQYNIEDKNYKQYNR